ncbi:methyl-accepting chemotaxis protein [Hwanghaeella sp.]|uniref:methyl-accepting chemotaxis protein n=1 Tax=Hwanghaeella sp. TaxID=2605943 RepID=UPI003CCBA907
MSIAVRIYMIVSLILLTAGAVAMTGAFQMRQVGTELSEIAHEDIPLLEKVSAITLHQAQQTILLEKILRAAGLKQGVDLDKAAGEFLELAKDVDREIKEGEAIAEHAIDNAFDAETRAEFDHVLEVLKRIEVSHKTFDDHAEDVMRAAAAGDMATATQMVETVEQESAALNKELQALLLELERFTEGATIRALDHEVRGLWLMIVIAVVGSLAGIVAGVILGRGITRPVVGLAAVMDRMGQGSREETVVWTDRTDEIGSMARSVSTFQDGLREADRLTAERIAESEAKARRAEQREKAIAEFDAVIREVVENVSTGATQLKTSSESMSHLADDTDKKSDAVAAASEEMSANIQSVSAAADELSAAISEISSQASETHRSAISAAEKVQASTAQIEKLAHSTQEIGDVALLIQEIAERTNLLALNATIESARAGEAGKGFAVVAHEVKELANQTQKATERISAQISVVQGDAAAAVSAVRDIGSAIDTLSQISESIAAAVEQQTAATGEIARNIDQASLATSEVTENIAMVSKDAKETSSASAGINTTAENLRDRSKVLSESVTSFFAQMREA